jgi:diguanylate cyclase (GGDEF)-like protein
MKKQFYIISGLFFLCVILFLFKVSINSQIYDIIDLIKYLGFIFSTVGFIYTLTTSKKFTKLIDVLKDEAMHDGMTGLLNHKFFEKRLDEEIERSNRYKEQITILFLDLDNFKRINDTYGHQVGDYVLMITASIIEDNVRNIDIVSRYGGEEFCVILVNAKKEDSLKTADRIRKQIEDYEFCDKKINEHLTISIGMGEFPTDGENREDIIKYSDHRMYMAKEDGRNCIR